MNNNVTALNLIRAIRNDVAEIRIGTAESLGRLTRLTDLVASIDRRTARLADDLEYIEGRIIEPALRLHRPA